MKFNKHIIIAGAALISLASCENKTIEPSQSDIDKEVALKVVAESNRLQTECDERVMALANTKADSILVAKANKPVPVAPAPKPTAAAPAPKAKTPAPKTKTPPPPPAPPKNPKSDRFDKTNSDGKKTVTEKDTKTKADRFDNPSEKKVVTPEQTQKKGERFK